VRMLLNEEVAYQMSHFWLQGRFSGMDVAHAVSHFRRKRGFRMRKWLTG